MKKLLTIFLAFLLLLSALSGCSRGTADGERGRTAYAGRTVQANGLIWTRAEQLHSSFNSVRWYDPATGNTGSLHSDPLCLHGMEDQKSCPLAEKQIMSIAAQGNLVWFFNLGYFFDEDDPSAWYCYDYAAQTMKRIADFRESNNLPSSWCIADGWLWYAYFEDPSFGDGKNHIKRAPADGSGLEKEAEDMAPGGLDDFYTFFVDGGKLYAERMDGSLCRMSDGRIWEHVLVVRDGFVYQTKNSRPMELPADLPESERTTPLRVYDLWRTPVDGGEDGAVLLAEGVCSSPRFFGDLIVVTPADPKFFYSFLPTKRSKEEERIFGVDISGGRTLIFDAATGEKTGEITAEGFNFYGIVGAGEDWIVAHGLDCRDFEPTGELKTLEGVTQEDMTAHESYFRIDRKTGEITRVDPAFWQ
ncbi:MAG: hypothetical protein E7576_03710 [Ruminococcaceae bacterium]|nr:hypothetical protein [Oscillospiraceae bacterium]